MDENNLKMKKEAIKEIETWSPIQMQQVQMWINSLNRICAKISQGFDNEETYSLFWVRLQQLFEEINPYFSKTKTTLESLTVKREREDPSSRHGKLYSTYSNILKTIESIEKHFSEAELVTIEYERHVGCHVFQEGYLKRGFAKKDGTIGFKRVKRGKHPIDTVQQMLQATLKANRNTLGRVDERYMARVFASRISATVNRLNDLINAWISK